MYHVISSLSQLKNRDVIYVMSCHPCLQLQLKHNIFYGIKTEINHLAAMPTTTARNTILRQRKLTLQAHNMSESREKRLLQLSSILTQLQTGLNTQHTAMRASTLMHSSVRIKAVVFISQRRNFVHYTTNDVQDLATWISRN